MAAKSDASASRSAVWLVLASLVILGAWFFPPFHVVHLSPVPSDSAAKGPSSFDAKATATEIWRDQIPAAAAQSTDVALVISALRKDADRAKAQYGKTAGIGAAYFFVRGHGRITAHERNDLIVAVDGAPGEVVALRIGPVFGNTVRDGCGLLNLNSFPGLAEFNALSAELNALVEQTVLPTLRQRGKVGAAITFAGCAEAPDFAADPGEPVLAIVPVEAQLP